MEKDVEMRLILIRLSELEILLRVVDSAVMPSSTATEFRYNQLEYVSKFVVEEGEPDQGTW